METTTTTHDLKLFSRMIDMLVQQGTNRHDYGMDLDSLGSIAVVMHEQGFRNKYGGNLNANALKQTIYRIRQKYDLSDLEPDWSEFDGPEAMHRQFTNVVTEFVPKHGFIVIYPP